MKKHALSDYIRAFSGLKRANGPFPLATKRKAPHKPLLLLAVMDMVARNAIKAPTISFSVELTELASIFSAYWRCVVPGHHVSSIAFPFSRLGNEATSFWHLIPLDGHGLRPATTMSKLKSFSSGVRLDADLFNYMKDPSARAELTAALLVSHFSEEGQLALRAEIEVQRQVSDYSEELERSITSAKAADNKEKYSESVRSQGFRRAVVHCYDHRCAICGTRIVTADGYSAVEAAHIKPWSQFKNDSIDNGMALCKLCHWAFDEGVLSVSAEYRVLVSRQLSATPNAPGYLLTLAGRDIMKPTSAQLWPSLDNIAWHRDKLFLRH